MKDNKIKVLSDIEHVLTRPSMYIGSISKNREEIWILEGDSLVKKEVDYIPGFLTLFREIVSNSIDEFVRTGGKYSNQISIDIDDKFVQVSDNGRGISTEDIDVQGEKIPASVVAFTRLKSGSNFSDDGSTIGMNGVGAACTNIFSSLFQVQTISLEGEKTTLTCKNNLQEIDYKKRRVKNGNGTIVKYFPDWSRFSIKSFDETHKALIQKIVFEYSICYPGINFKINGKTPKTKTFKKYLQLYGENFESFSFNNIDIGIFSGEGENVSFVNGINTKRGGTHVDYILNGISSKVREFAQKRFKEIKPADVKNKLFWVINIRDMKAPRFDSQTKEQLSNSLNDLKEVFSDLDLDLISKKIWKNKDLMFSILETFKIKEELKKRRELSQKEKKIRKKKIPKLIDANIKDREKAVLYITEGQSALSNFISVRSGNEGGYPLRGKVISPQDTPLDRLLKNKEIVDILSALNLKLTDKDISSLNFGKIVIQVDADEDGGSILCTLLNFFYTFWPDLFRQGRVYRSISPLIVAKHIETGEIKDFYTLSQFTKERDYYKIISHNKGLGSLSKQEYRKMMDNLVKIEEDSLARETLDMAFGSDSGLRKKWLIGESIEKN
ncbi:MAG: ATP-binding protein [Nanoarchaeota archaeon]